MFHSAASNCPSIVLAAVDFRSPVLWAVMIGWILSVTLHELAHGIVAYLGGDYTIRERGGLTLNPFKYMDPFLSIVLPLIFLLMGGVPLPGGVTYVRSDLLRGRLWDTAVSLAGPAMNFFLFLLMALPFHPRFGWIHYTGFNFELTPFHQFLGTMVVLQFEILIINLMPIPPLDGFGAIFPYFDPASQRIFTLPQVRYGGFLFLSFVVLRVPGVINGIYHLTDSTLLHLGFDKLSIMLIGEAFNKVMFSE